MRPFGIELVDEGIEALLLLQAVGTRCRVVSLLRVRCMRSWRPFCCGWPGLMRSMAIPSLSRAAVAQDDDTIALEGRIFH